MKNEFKAWYKLPAKEKIAYVGCIHGGDERFIKRLWDFTFGNCPDCMIFLGDFIGTREFEDLQRLFYNYVNNHSKNELFKENPEATDEEIINYIGSNPPIEEGKKLNLKEGYRCLLAYELKLSGLSKKEIDKKINFLTDRQIASEIRRLADFGHYGHYASNLPQKAKEALASGLKENADKLLEPIKALQDQGVEICMLEGNWDARAPIDFKPNKSEVIPLPKKERLFNLSDYMDKNNISFLDELSLLETKTTLQILVPFDAIINASEKSNLEDLKDRVKKARAKNKTIILAGHGEPSWIAHNLLYPNSVPRGEHAQLIKGYEFLASNFLPDEIVYDHMHDRMKDSNGVTIDANWKYVLEVTESNELNLITDPKKFGKRKGQIVATYIPFRETALLVIQEGEHRIKGFGGERNPIEVIITRDKED